MKTVKVLFVSLNRVIDLKIGIAGAIVMGTMVFTINFILTKNFGGSFTAALKQGSYTFLLGGFLMKSCETLAVRINKRLLALFFAVFLPSVFTLILTFSMHSLKGTPKPVESTLPTLIIVPATAVWGFKKRNQLEKQI